MYSHQRHPGTAGHNHEQQAQLDSIMKFISCLPAGLSDCGTAGNSGNGSSNSRTVSGNVTVKDVELARNAVVLEQNVPNPFADETTIRYFIPVDAAIAQMLFYDNLGRVIKTVDVTKKAKES